MDIAALGVIHHDGKEEWATSMAAPRVAAVAEILFREFPTITNALMKLALLLGASVPKGRVWGYAALPVRSGGVLNKAATQHLLREMNRVQRGETRWKSERVRKFLADAERGQIAKEIAKEFLRGLVENKIMPNDALAVKLQALEDGGVIQ